MNHRPTPSRRPRPATPRAARPSRPVVSPEGQAIARERAARVRRERMARQKQKEQTTVILLLCGIFLMTAILIGTVLSNRARKPVTPPIGTAQSTGGQTDPTTDPEGTDGTGEPSGTTAPPVTDPVTTAPPETQPVVMIPSVTFTADLAAYEKYMNPEGDQRDAYLLLVNPQNPVSAADAPTDLTDLTATRKDGRATQQMRLYAAKAMEAMFAEADALGHLNMSTGYMLSVTSAYRSYSYQDYLFNLYVDQEMAANPSLSRAQAEAIVEKYSCRAGTSEHQSGLCADLHNQVSANEDYPEIFANTPEGKWITENCWKFGFVLRFPPHKTEITGISYESWHFRYVGRYHAYLMNEKDMCLEEYVEYLAQQA